MPARRMTPTSPGPAGPSAGGRPPGEDGGEEPSERPRDARRPGASRHHRREVDEPQVQPPPRQPGQQAPLRDHRGGHRAGRRGGGRLTGRAGLRRQGLHLPRLAPPGPLHRRPGRHQRGQELQERRRLRVPPVLRHGQGRRLPGPGVQRPPPGRGVGEHHRPVRRPGGAVRPGVQRAARQPQLRRRPGQPHVLRPGPDRPAAPAGRLPGPHAPDPAGQRSPSTTAPR